jgi:hypothetical protein
MPIADTTTPAIATISMHILEEAGAGNFSIMQSSQILPSKFALGYYH